MISVEYRSARISTVLTDSINIVIETVHHRTEVNSVFTDTDEKPTRTDPSAALLPTTPFLLLRPGFGRSKPGENFSEICHHSMFSLPGKAVSVREKQSK